MRRSVTLGLVLLTAVGCDEAKESGKVPLAAMGQAASGQAAGTVAGGAPSMAADNLSGTVTEQIAAPPYVYLKLKTETGEAWVAVNQAKIDVGQKVTVYGAILMENFESKTLNRTFKQVYFGSLEPTAGADPSAGAAGGAAGGASSMGSSVGTPPAVDAKVGKVEKASGADAKTIGELWAQKGALDGKTVTIRGVVVKYNPQVMGKNWIHLQDGSGTAAQNTHDITVTTTDEAAMGATITIRGTVRQNKDFGAGYSYALIIEDAKVSK
jgi:hypothetical protein